MDAARLQQIGLSVQQSGADLLAQLELQEEKLVNPITRAPLSHVVFRVNEDVLVPHAPAELAWIAPVKISRVESASELRKQLATAFNEYVFVLERRSTELQAMGVVPDVDAATLELTADVKEGGLHFVIAADRRGNFELVRAMRDGTAIFAPEGCPFELSEHRDQSALVAFLTGLVNVPAVSRAASQGIRFSEVAAKLHADAFIPPTSPLEVLIELEANGVRYRFAAARVAGRTFRGLLASRLGKVWADRFELDDFPGVIPLLSKLLNVAPEQIRVVAGN